MPTEPCLPMSSLMFRFQRFEALLLGCLLWAAAPFASAQGFAAYITPPRFDVKIAPGARSRFRFEIPPPPGTPARECRFAIMVEGVDPAKSSVDVGGRIGVIVYAAIGGAAPLPGL